MDVGKYARIFAGNDPEILKNYDKDLLKLSFRLGWVGGKFPKLPERRCRIFLLPTAFMSLLPVAEHWLTLITVLELTGNVCQLYSAVTWSRFTVTCFLVSVL
jgi:hypothetical protein